MIEPTYALRNVGRRLTRAVPGARPAGMLRMSNVVPDNIVESSFRHHSKSSNIYVIEPTYALRNVGQRLTGYIPVAGPAGVL